MAARPQHRRARATGSELADARNSVPVVGSMSGKVGPAGRDEGTRVEPQGVRPRPRGARLPLGYRLMGGPRSPDRGGSSQQRRRPDDPGALEMTYD